MFRISIKHGKITNRIIKNDCKDVKNYIFCETNNMIEAQEAYDWCSNTCFGKSFKRGNYLIECFNETKVKDGYQTVADAITSRTNIQHKYAGVIENELVWKFFFMEGVLFFNMATNTIGFRMYIDREYDDEFKITARQDVKDFINKVTTEINRLKPKYKFEDKRLLQAIADEITNKTGIAHNFIGYDNESLTWDFAFGTSYMKNNCGKGLYFAINDPEGRELFNISTVDLKRFINNVVSELKKANSNKQHSKTIRNDEIINGLQNAIKSNQEWHCRVYADKCWWADIERHPYGTIRFWVGYEYANGKMNSSLFTITNYNNSLNHSCNFEVKKPVCDKLYRLYKELNNKGLIS